MSQIVLYFAPRTRSTRPRWVLEELRLTCEIHEVKLAAGEHKRNSYIRDVHPLERVPVLRDGPVKIFESHAICMYLADKYGLGTLAPEINSPERPIYLQWTSFAIGTLEPLIFELARSTQDQSMEKSKTSTLADIAKLLEETLSITAYLVGDRLTVADILVGGLASWGTDLGLFQDHRQVQTWVSKLRSRTAFQTANG